MCSDQKYSACHSHMQTFNKEFVPDPTHKTGGFEQVFAPSPWADQGDAPMPIGWKVLGAIMSDHADARMLWQVTAPAWLVHTRALPANAHAALSCVDPYACAA